MCNKNLNKWSCVILIVLLSISFLSCIPSRVLKDSVPSGNPKGYVLFIPKPDTVSGFNITALVFNVTPGKTAGERFEGNVYNRTGPGGSIKSRSLILAREPGTYDFIISSADVNHKTVKVEILAGMVTTVEVDVHQTDVRYDFGRSSTKASYKNFLNCSVKDTRPLSDDDLKTDD